MNPFITWITTYGSIIGFFVQMAFYLTVAAAAVWAATTFARYVRFMTFDEEMLSASEFEEDEEDEDLDAMGDEGESEDEEKSVEEFVE